MFNNLKLGAKIGGGYAIMGLILVTIVLATIWQVNRVQAVNHRIMELRAPTARSSLMISMASTTAWLPFEAG